MKKLLILLLCLSLIATCFIGCDSNDKNLDDKETSSSDTSVETTGEETIPEITETKSDTTSADASDTVETTIVTESETIDTTEYVSSYEIQVIDGQWYMIFNSYEVRPKNYEDDFIEGYPMNFESLKDFKDSVLNKELSITQMEYIVRYFERDDIGINVVDFNNLYTPSVPNSWEILEESEIWWSDGLLYKSLEIRSDEYYGSGYLFVMGEDIFNESSNYSYYNHLRTIQNKAKEVKICNLHSNTTLFVKENDLYYKYVFDNDFSEMSDEFILSFGVEEYIEVPADNQN